MNTEREKTIIAEFVKAFAHDLLITQRDHYTDVLCQQIATERDESKIPALIRAVIAEIRKELKPPKPTEDEYITMRVYPDLKKIKSYVNSEPSGHAECLYRQATEAIAHLRRAAYEQDWTDVKTARDFQLERAARLVRNGYTKQEAAKRIFSEDTKIGLTNGYPNAEALRQGLTVNAPKLGLPVEKGKRGRKKQNPAGREAPAANEATATRTNAKRKKPKE